MEKLNNFIEKVISEYEEHFKKGNKTLGTLPSDWKHELYELVYDLCEKQKQECANESEILIIDLDKPHDKTKHKSYIFSDENYYHKVRVSKDSILNTENVCKQ